MTLPGKDKGLTSILLNSHMDVVPVSREKWSRDPFAADLEADGRIIARGSQDMKCVGMAYIEAIRRLKLSGKVFSRSIHLAFVPDEEIGGAAGASKLSSSDILQDLNVGICLDEGVPCPVNRTYLFNAERSVWWIRITATGPAGHGSSLLQGTAVERLLTVLNKFSEWRASELKALAAHDGDLGAVTSINITVLKVRGCVEDSFYVRNYRQGSKPM